MRLAHMLPAVVNWPPAYRPPLPSSARALTLLFIPFPLPNTFQATPSRRAMKFAGTPPAVVKVPPA